jgi:carboxylesterase
MSIQDQGFIFKGGKIGVLLIHGLGGSPSEMRFVANGLARAGYTVHCPVLAGHRSADDLKAVTWWDWYRSAKRALNQLSRQCETVVVGGLSTGAVLSLLLAARHPEKVHAVTLYSPALWLSGSHVPWYAPLFRLVMSKRFANLFRFPFPSHVGIKDQRIRDFIRNAISGDQAAPAGAPGGAVLERRRLASKVMKELGRITQPALIIHSREDDYAGLDNASYLQKKLAGPVDLTVLDDSYHMVTIDRQRHLVVERTAAFLDRLAGGVKQERAKPRLAVVAGTAVAVSAA